MSDIVERLRESTPEHTGFDATYHIYQYRLGLLAADYIERLEAALKDCVEELESGIETEHELEAEHSKAARELVSRARAALQTGGAG